MIIIFCSLFPVSLFNNNNFQTDQFDEMGPLQVLPLWIRVDLGIMAKKEFSTFPGYPDLQRYSLVPYRGEVLIYDQIYVCLYMCRGNVCN